MTKNDAQTVLKIMLTVFKILYYLALCAIVVFCYYHTWFVTKDTIGLIGMSVLVLLLHSEGNKRLHLDNENAKLKKELDNLRKNV
jgi:hypothetical protein